uniref:Uncharacterized protein MANES_09G174100 n=1 Tax=Rhizophora mucronata TaxID=61149 RepID=A0A2P2MSI6_RHIMU
MKHQFTQSVHTTKRTSRYHRKGIVIFVVDLCIGFPLYAERLLIWPQS